MVRDTPWEQPIPRPTYPKKNLSTDNVIFRGKKSRREEIQCSCLTPKVTGYFLECTAFILGMVQKGTPSERGWPATTCHTKLKFAAASPVSLPMVVWLQPAAESGPSRVGVGRDVLALFHVCQNALCKIKYPIKYPFNACISVQPTHWNTSCRSGAAVLFNVWWTSTLNMTAWNGACGPISRLVTWHETVLLWLNGVGDKKSGFCYISYLAGVLLAARVPQLPIS